MESTRRFLQAPSWLNQQSTRPFASRLIPRVSTLNPAAMKYVLIALFVFTGFCVHAQSGRQYTLGYNVLYPFPRVQSLLNLQAEARLSPHLGFQITAGGYRSGHYGLQSFTTLTDDGDPFDLLLQFTTRASKNYHFRGYMLTLGPKFYIGPARWKARFFIHPFAYIARYRQDVAFYERYSL
jgi:hypothetical protein